MAAASEKQRNELFAALRHGRSSDVKKILGKSPHLANVVDSEEMSPLHLAAGGDDAELVRLLVSLGASQTQRDRRGWTALHLACGSVSAAFLDVLDVLLASPSSPVKAKTDSSNTPLSLLAINTSWSRADKSAQYSAVVNRLIDMGADPNSRNEQDVTPLHEAVGRMNLVAIEALLARGANINARTRDGATPLHWAVQIGDARTVRALLDRAADIYVVDSPQTSPLDLGLRSPNPEIKAFFQDPDLPQKQTPPPLSPSLSSSSSSSSSSSPALTTSSTSDELFCKICMENKIDTVVLPCGHSVLCHDCADDIRSTSAKCPICRASIDSTMRIFLS